MSPKEKAKELIRQFYSVGAIECKQCALIVVDEILISKQDLPIYDVHWDYWQSVKKEIEKL